jgi:WD40 repeat protein
MTQAGNGAAVEPLTARVYRECCAARDVKPNHDIICQLTSNHALHLRGIDCSRTFLGAHGVQALLDFVALHQCIHHLDLTNNGVDTPVIGRLVELLAMHQTLAEITLCRNELSTPGARHLWEAARQSKNLQYVDLRDTQLAGEWTARIEKQLEVNREYNEQGYLSTPLPRSQHTWTTLTLFVVVGPGMRQYAELLDSSVIPVINKAVAAWRVRVVAAVHCETEPEMDQINAHMRLATDAHAEGLAWVVTLVGEEVPAAWMSFLKERVISMQRVAPPPIRNKVGQNRDPVRRIPITSFCYIAPIAPRDVLDLTPQERARNELYTELRASQATLCHDIRSDDALQLRATTDLFHSIETLYKTPDTVSDVDPSPRRRSSAVSTVTAETGAAADHPAALDRLTSRMVELCQHASMPSSARPTELDKVLRYCERPVAGAAFPFVLYGTPGSGRSAVLNHTFSHLVREYRGTHTIIPFSATEVQSTTVFLLYVLHHFGGHPTTLGCGARDGLNFDLLQLAAHDAIKNYPVTEKPIILLVKNADLLDHVWRPDFVPTLWLPRSFPENVRIVLSVATESAFLSAMRGREQQPYDLLLRPAPRNEFMKLLRVSLDKVAAKPVPGLGAAVEDLAFLTQDATGVATTARSAPAAIFAKQDSDMSMYAVLLAALINSDQVTKPRHFETEQSVVDYLCTHEEVPHTCEGIVRLLHGYAEHLYGEKLLKDLIMTICATQVSLPEIVYFSETVHGNPRFATMPLVVQLTNLNLIEVTSTGIVRPRHLVTHRTMLAQYPTGTIDEYRSTLAVHFTQHLWSRDQAFDVAFDRLVELLLHVGDIGTLFKVLTDIVLLDDLVRVRPGVQIRIYDAYWRTIHHIEHLRDVQMPGFESHQFISNEQADILHRSLPYFVTCSPKIWQSALGMPFDSPLYRAAMRADRVPYPSARRVNRQYNEQCSVFRAQVDDAGLIHCSINGAVACTTSRSGTVEVVDVYSRQCVRRESFATAADRARVHVVGATVCDLDVILVIAKDRLIRWNWRLNEQRVFLGFTASLRSVAVRGDGKAVVAIQLPEEDSFEVKVVILDVEHGRVMSFVPYDLNGEAVREAHFVVMEHVLVVGNYRMHMTRGNGAFISMNVGDVVNCIRSVAASRDGSWFVVAAGSNVYLMGSTGETLHEVSVGTDTVLDVNFHPNGSLFLASTATGAIDVRHTLSGQLRRRLKTSVGPAEHFTFTPDGTKLLARCGPAMRMFDGTTFEDLGAISAHDGWIKYICVENSAFISCCDAGIVKLWDASRAFPSLATMAASSEGTTDLVASSFISHEPVTHVVAGPASAGTIAVRSASGRVTVWGVSAFGSAESTIPKIGDHAGVAGTVAFLSDARLVAMKNPRHLHLIPTRLDHTAQIAALPGDVEQPPSWEVRVAEHEGEEIIALAAVYHNGARIFVYTAATLALRCQFVGHSKPVTGMVVAHSAVVTTSEDGLLTVWSLLSKAERTSLKHGTPIVSLEVLPATSNLLFSDSARAITEVSLAGYNFTTVRVFTPTWITRGMRLLRDDLFALASDSPDVPLLHWPTGSIVNTLRAYTSIVSITVEQARGRLAFFGSSSGTVEVFQLLGL